MKKSIVLLTTAIALTGCNRIARMDKDVEAAGSAVDKAVPDAKRKM